nr:MAG: internal scaffolding protein [Microviridae sp.]
MKVPFFRTPYNYDTNAVSDETGLKCEDASLAVQADLIPSDINTIMKRFGVTGELPQGIRAPTYGDFTGIFDFQSAVNSIALANESFDSMPADVRARFHNNTQEFVEFCSNEANASELDKLGLLKPKYDVVTEAVTTAKISVD